MMGVACPAPQVYKCMCNLLRRAAVDALQPNADIEKVSKSSAELEKRITEIDATEKAGRRLQSTVSQKPGFIAHQDTS